MSVYYYKANKSNVKNVLSLDYPTTYFCISQGCVIYTPRLVATSRNQCTKHFTCFEAPGKPWLFRFRFRLGVFSVAGICLFLKISNKSNVKILLSSIYQIKYFALVKSVLFTHHDMF